MRRNNNILLIIVLTLVSLFTYMIQFLLFHKPGDQFFYLFQDLAFLPMQVVVVTVVFDRLLAILERRSRLKNMNVLISAFFSDIGNSILYAMAENQISDDGLAQLLDHSHFKEAGAYREMSRRIQEHRYKIDVNPDKLQALKDLLLQKRAILLDLLGNSRLSEHETFTDMLWSLFHIADELAHRDLGRLSKADLAHLRRDIQRAYPLLLLEWVQNLKYLHDEYPYMFDSSIRFSPLTDSSRILAAEEYL